MEKVQPSDRLRKEIRSFLQDMGSASNGAEALSELVRLATTLMVQEGLEAEQTDYVGREHYQRGEGNGYRSGYKPGHLDTAEGRVNIDLPQIRDAHIPFRSRLFDHLRGDSQMVEHLATEMGPVHRGGYQHAPVEVGTARAEALQAVEGGQAGFGVVEGEKLPVHGAPGARCGPFGDGSAV